MLNYHHAFKYNITSILKILKFERYTPLHNILKLYLENYSPNNPYFNPSIMRKNFTLLAIFFSLYICHSQVVINEVDSDTPGTDIGEFVELKSTSPNFSLNGYVLVLYNGGTTGTGNLSYKAYDLSPYSTDVNGIFHAGNPLVAPTPALVITNNTFQNGPDAIALYKGNLSDFPTNTIAHKNGLIDAITYTNLDVNGIQPTELMTIFGISACPYDYQPLNSESKSIQRKADGSYEYKTPTPGLNNDGSGVILTYLSVTSNNSTINEGQTLEVTISSSKVISGTALTIPFTLINGNFTTSDYSGTTSVTIPIGASLGTTSITIIDDGINDGDEELQISAQVPNGYTLNNNNVIVRVKDFNFKTASFGTPSKPTYGQVKSAAPKGYYDSLEGLSGANLKTAIQNIIANPAVVRAQTYGDVVDILKEVDQNPENSNEVWLIYTEESRSKIDYQTGNSIIGKWNREHIYCQSRGNYGDLYNTSSDGIGKYALSGPDDIGAGLSDAHHIRAVDGQENTSRNNRNYGVDYNGPTSGTTTWKGDVARALFYMAVRYNGLNVINGDPSDGTIGEIGDLTTLLKWNLEDAADDFEMNRNNLIYNWQMNRNPFIDYPLLADYVFGSNYGKVWHAALSNEDFVFSNVSIYPNPTHDELTISGLELESNLKLYSISGVKVVETNFSGTTKMNLDLPVGIYLAKIESNQVVMTRKIQIY